MPYELEFVNPGSSYQQCKVCRKTQCKRCLVPYIDKNLNEVLTRYGLEQNNTLFHTAEF